MQTLLDVWCPCHCAHGLARPKAAGPELLVENDVASTKGRRLLMIVGLPTPSWIFFTCSPWPWREESNAHLFWAAAAAAAEPSGLGEIWLGDSLRKTYVQVEVRKWSAELIYARSKDYLWHQESAKWSIAAKLFWFSSQSGKTLLRVKNSFRDHGRIKAKFASDNNWSLWGYIENPVWLGLLDVAWCIEKKCLRFATLILKLIIFLLSRLCQRF